MFGKGLDVCCGSCPHAWPNFKNLSSDEIKELSKHRFQSNFSAGETIFKAGSPTASAVFLSSGIAKVYLEGFDGKKIILNLAKPGYLLAGPGNYVDSTHHYSVVALTDVTACFIDMNLIKSYVRKNPMFAEGYLKDISSKSLRIFYKMMSLVQKKMPGRMAEGILSLADEVYGADEFNPILSRQELGELTGMAKENVVRIMKEFCNEGIISTNGSTITIKDKEKLKLISANG
ncbi:Crp/Fnr family transcriptional regulator [Ancylomarina subtilis]|uniref:Crp/Fnr family transcriptional regulator n=1 Tax=Ancylomarina subtilis TaxID=1639035 RepID=A0A4Q7VM66_9BACT|nr:Crp/Fnr family transcriptional regulator [Ancylomarina subtilis]RZT97227.1 Crp/Fnr family transcriptional regulator [Ancylomarina subtilis]